MSSDTDVTQDLRPLVTEWLLAEGWQLAERSHQDATWLLEARDSAHRVLLVGQKRSRMDQVLIEATVGISPEHREGLTGLTPAARQDLAWDLRFRLLQLGLEFNGVQEPLERISLGQRIYRDGLSKDAFLQRVSLVRNGILAVIWTVARQLNAVAPVAETGELGIN